MIKIRTVAVVLIASAFLIGAGNAEVPPAEDGEDRIMGEYAGMCAMPDGDYAPAQARVIAEGDGKYRAVLTADTPDPMKIELHTDPGAEGMVLKGSYLLAEWTVKIEDNMLFATAEDGKGESFCLLRTERRSPTEGLAPPRGAVVLLPYEEGEPTSLEAWTNPNWKVPPTAASNVTFLLAKFFF